MNPANGAVVEASRLTRRYGELTAVDAITFAAQRGEVFGSLIPAVVTGVLLTLSIRLFRWE